MAVSNAQGVKKTLYFEFDNFNLIFFYNFNFAHDEMSFDTKHNQRLS